MSIKTRLVGGERPRYRRVTRLSQNERLIAAGRAFSEVYHEYNSYMTAAGIGADLLGRDEGLPREIRSKARDIVGVLGRIEQIFAYVRSAYIRGYDKTKNPVEYCEAAEVVRKKIKAFQSIYRTALHFSQDEKMEGAKVRIRPEPFGATVHSLLLNAQEHGAENIWVSLTEIGGNRLQIEIRDDGEGFPPPLKKRLFEEGFTTKSKSGGGHGIPIAIRLIQAYGGSFDINSEGIGLGCTVTVILPIAARE